uniref:uncharacterized protein LOC101308527 n=1 Tax=Fragaria vesca subsp. vesca TaxID=101020 RepID=UPI0005C80367|nr:PREDICTED: uncharacterized protein LOC101308527 [Fragaria vesca subsp. vesca]
METFNPTGVSMLLTIDTKRNRVLFAETSKEAVDFLFSLLSLPVATVISLLSGDGMVGCIGNLYESVEDLGDTHLEPNFNKDMLLKPKATVVGADILGVNNNVCKSCSCHFPGYVCPLCECAVSTTAASTGEAPCSNGGYVKGGVVFVIMDNLVVKPMSTVSIIDVLKELNVMEVDALEQKLVSLGKEEGLKLVQASLESNTVLSSIFLGFRKSHIGPMEWQGQKLMLIMLALILVILLMPFGMMEFGTDYISMKMMLLMFGGSVALTVMTALIDHEP